MHNDIGVWTYSSAQGWVLHGDYIPVTFNDGDQFGARAKADGDVEVYKNGVLLGVRNVSSWEYYAGGGRIGIWFVDVTGALLDDFGGGTLAGGEGLMAQGSSFIEGDDLLERLQTNPKPTRTPSPAGTPTATQTPTPPQSGFDLNPIANFEPVNFKLPAPVQQASSLIIDYTYDPLNRLTSAMYSDGRNFAYTYDASGNVLELEQNLGPGTIITTYTYDEANQLNTAQQGSTIWQYTYDANGSLISDGVKNYTYNSANRLVQVSDQLSVTSLSYNGLGQRLSMDAAGVIATYVLDGDRPLTATSNGNTTFYLYGLGGIGEETNAWSYSLPDGTNTPRQLSDLSGDITLSARYTPWGDTLDSFGTGNFTFGYLGGVLDGATGLLYVGNGQFYDPATGRFLTRDVNPDSTNPYVPWNPIGALLGPLAVVSLFYTRKKKGSKTGTFLVLLIVLGGVGMTLVGCGLPAGQVTITAISTPGSPINYTATFDNGLTVTGTLPASSGIPTDVLAVPCQTLEPSTQTPTSTPTPIIAPIPSPACIYDCYDSYLTYAAVVNQLGRIPSMEEVLYMTADTEYTAYSGTEDFGQEGLARTYYSVCYVKDYVNGCQDDEFYNFLAGYEPWSDRKLDNNKKTPTERAQHLIKALGSNKDWLWTDVRQITDFNYANPLGWTQGKIGNQPWQWFGPFTPSKNCSRNVKPSISIDVGNGLVFWMLTADGNDKFQSYCPNK